MTDNSEEKLAVETFYGRERIPATLTEREYKQYLSLVISDKKLIEAILIDLDRIEKHRLYHEANPTEFEDYSKRTLSTRCSLALLDKMNIIKGNRDASHILQGATHLRLLNDIQKIG